MLILAYANLTYLLQRGVSACALTDAYLCVGVFLCVDVHLMCGCTCVWMCHLGCVLVNVR
jgi:hypothetical protein